jgi:hypothetical protein
MVLKIVVFIIGLVVFAVIAAYLYGNYRWNAKTDALLARLEAAREPTKTTIDFREIADLPPVVQRFFRVALNNGAPIPTAMTVAHTGTFNMGQSADNWKSFTSRQRTVMRKPGFVWDARVAMMPGLDVHVHDAYVAGEGVLNPAIGGLFSLADLRGTPEIAEGEFMRFFAEAAMYPTALLPSQGVRWEGVDDVSARAVLSDRGITITLLFRFGKDALIESVRAEKRGRTVEGKVIQTPWEGRWTNYTERDGMKVPMDGEVAWILPDRRAPYWRGHATALAYEY